VSSGEQIGQLSRVLSRLADYIERRNALVQRVRLAFTYPAIVTVVAFAIVIFLLTYVVPQIVSVFANTKQKLPLPYVMMLGVSNFVRAYGHLCRLARHRRLVRLAPRAAESRAQAALAYLAADRARSTASSSAA
jgi:general secretion pathway protein F